MRSFMCLVLWWGVAGPVMASAFSEDFEQFLAREYPNADFVGAGAGVNSGYGGREDATQAIVNRPVVFVHGNTDRAIGGHSRGWAASIEALQARGYTSAELYALTWGDGTQSSAPANHHAPEFILRVRRFLEAVLKYTGAEQIDVMGHSMGVTLSRRAIKGGMIGGRNFAPLTERVAAFIGIAGANRGIGACLNPLANLAPTCWTSTGFHPESAYLAELNADPRREGLRVYSIWSEDDEVLNQLVVGQTNPVPSPVSCKIPEQDGEAALTRLGHLEVRDQTLEEQWRMIEGTFIN